MRTVKPTPETIRKAVAGVDWDRIDAMTDEDIARQIAENPDAAPDQAEFLEGLVRKRRLEAAARAVREVRTAAGFAAWRKALGFTQIEAAAELGISRRTIQNYESGAAAVPRTVAAALAAGIKAPVE